MEILKVLRVQWDRTLAVVAALIGALCLLLGYVGVSGTGHVAAQLPYFISGGLFGIFLLAVGCTSWVSADLKDEWRELHTMRQLLDEDLQLRAAGVKPAGSNGHGDAINEELLAQIRELDAKVTAVTKRASTRSTASGSTTSRRSTLR